MCAYRITQDEISNTNIIKYIYIYIYECMRTLEEKMKTLIVLTIAIYNSDCLDKHGSCVSS